MLPVMALQFSALSSTALGSVAAFYTLVRNGGAAKLMGIFVAFALLVTGIIYFLLQWRKTKKAEEEAEAAAATAAARVPADYTSCKCVVPQQQQQPTTTTTTTTAAA
jgi:hypothetical protein